MPDHHEHALPGAIRVSSPRIAKPSSEEGTTPTVDELIRLDCPLCGNPTEVNVPGADRPPGGEARVIEVVCSYCGLGLTIERAPPKPPGPGERDQHDTHTDMPEGLRHWLAGEPIRRHDLSDWQELGRWCQRRPFTAGLLAMVASIAIGAGLASAVGYLRTQADLHSVRGELAETETQRAEAQTLADRQSQLADQRRRRIAEETAARTLAQRLLAQSRQREAEAQRECGRARKERIEALHYARLELAEQLAQQSRQALQTRPVDSLLLAGSSARLMFEEGKTPGRRVEQTMRDGLAAVGVHRLPGHEDAIRSMAIGPRGRWLVTGSDDATARLWDLEAESPAEASLVLKGHRGQIHAVAISPDGRWLVTAGADGAAALWNLAAADPAAPAFVLSGHQGPIYAVAISADSRWLVTAGGSPGSEQTAACVWDLAADDPSVSPILLRGHEKPIRAAAISPDGRWVVTAGEDSTARVWHLAGRYPAAEQVVLRGHEGWISTVAITPDSRQLITASYDGTVRVWDLAARDPNQGARVLRGHQGWVTALAVSPDGHWVASGSFDRTVCLWDLSTEDPTDEPVVLHGHSGRIGAVAFTPDGRWLASASFDATVRLWDLASDEPGAEPIVLRGHQSPICCLAISPKGNWLVTGSSDGYGRDNLVRLWQLRVESVVETAEATVAGSLSPTRQRDIVLEASQPRRPLR